MIVTTGSPVPFNVLLITANDGWLTPMIAENLKQADIKVAVLKVAVRKKERLKTIKICLLFGIMKTLSILLTVWRSSAKPDFTCQPKELPHFLQSQAGETAVILLVNYPLKVPPMKRKIYNLHPSLLPDFPGLMPIPRIALAKLEGVDCSFGATIHEITEDYDKGEILWQQEISHHAHSNLGDIYQAVYESAVSGLISLSGGKIKRPKTNSQTRVPEKYARMDELGLLDTAWLALRLIFQPLPTKGR